MKCSFDIIFATATWLAFASAKVTQSGDTASSVLDETLPGSYLVEFEDGQTASTFFGDLRDAGFKFQERQILDSPVFRGASFTILVAENTTESRVLSDSTAAALKVKYTWPVAGLRIPELHPSPFGPGVKASPKINRRGSHNGFLPHVLTQIDELHAEGYTGKGIRVAIVDSGIDYTHPALGGCFGPDCLVSFGQSFALEDAEAPENIMDPFGHGTHVAGTLAAQPNEYGFVGAAPGVKLGMYKISGGDPFYTATDDVLAAMLKAVEDEANILSMSIEVGAPWHNEPVAIAASRIVEYGIPVVVSVANSGFFGSWSGGSPASGKLVTAVGSSTLPEIPMFVVEGSWSVGVEPENEFGWIPVTRPAFPEDLNLPLWAASTDFQNGNLACDTINVTGDVPDLSETFVLARFDESECPALTAIQNLVDLGVKRILFYTTALPNLLEIRINVSLSDGIGLVQPGQAKAWLSQLQEGKEVIVTTRKPEENTTYLEIADNDFNPNVTSKFSSWGPTWGIDVKPQVVAPGEFILSTWLMSAGGYRVISGTSMATPLVAGLYALLMEARGTKDPAKLLRVLTSTAEPLNHFDGESVTDEIAPVVQQGTGLIQGMRAATVSTTLSRTSFSLNDTANFASNHSFEIVNNGKDDVTYTLSHVGVPAVVTFNKDTLFPESLATRPLIQDFAEIDLERDEITVPAGEGVEVTLSGFAPEGLNQTLLPVYGGYVKVEGSNDEKLLLPYVGVESGNFMSRWPDYNVPVPANATFKINKPEPGQIKTDTGDPIWRVYFRTGAPLFRLDLIALDDNDLPIEKFFEYTTLGNVNGSPMKWRGNNFSFGAFRGLNVSGVAVPEGRYQILASALRINGNADERDDWDIVMLPPFIVEYN